MSQCPIRIHDGQQGKHVPGHPNYELGRSILRADPAALLPLVGTGQAVNNVHKGEPGYRERVDFGRYIGECVDKETHFAAPTTKGMVHYGKLGVHIVPCNP